MESSGDGLVPGEGTRSGDGAYSTYPSGSPSVPSASIASCELFGRRDVSISVSSYDITDAVSEPPSDVGVVSIAARPTRDRHAASRGTAGCAPEADSVYSIDGAYFPDDLHSALLARSGSGSGEHL